MPGPHLVRLSSSKVIILRGCLCGHFPSDPGDVKQEVPKELNRAEPEVKSRLIQQIQGTVLGSDPVLQRLKTGRKGTQNIHGGYLRMGPEDKLHLLTLPHAFPKFSTSKQGTSVMKKGWCHHGTALAQHVGYLGFNPLYYKAKRINLFLKYV